MFLKRIFKGKNALSGREALVKMNECIFDQQLQINRLNTDLLLIKTERDALKNELDLIKQKTVKKRKKKKYKMMDAIGEIFQQTDEELNTRQVLEQLRVKVKIKKFRFKTNQTATTLAPLLQYMVKENKLSKGGKKGTFRKVKHHE